MPDPEFAIKAGGLMVWVEDRDGEPHVHVGRDTDHPTYIFAPSEAWQIGKILMDASKPPEADAPA